MALWLWLALAPALWAAKRPGQVQFSNGDVVEGEISLSPGEDLRVHVDGNQVRVLDFERVRELRLAPVEEKLVQKWRFLEAGQTKKEFSGQPYLIRSLQAVAVLADGAKITGHLYTTVLFVEPANGKARKVILPAKQRGKEGEGADALVYPSLIRFTDTAGATEDTIRLRLIHPDLGERAEVAALTWGALFTFEGKRSGGEYVLASPLGRDLIVGFMNAGKIVVGWPVASDPKWATLVQSNLANSEDFYDQRRLLGVYYDQPNEDVYSVLMMARQGATTLEGAKTQPWRLVVLRWKYDPESQRMLLAGRGFLFRGLLAKGEAPPSVMLVPALWKPRQVGAVWVAGGQ